jgi:hypothetical protein
MGTAPGRLWCAPVDRYEFTIRSSSGLSVNPVLSSVGPEPNYGAKSGFLNQILPCTTGLEERDRLPRDISFPLMQKRERPAQRYSRVAWHGIVSEISAPAPSTPTTSTPKRVTTTTKSKNRSSKNRSERDNPLPRNDKCPVTGLNC